MQQMPCKPQTLGFFGAPVHGLLMFEVFIVGEPKAPRSKTPASLGFRAYQSVGFKAYEGSGRMKV